MAIDLETTGLDAGRDAAVAVAVVPFRGGEPAGGYETLVNPGRPIPAASTRIHGITDEMVAAAPPLGDVLDEIEAMCGEHVIVGHGVAFDLAILERARRAHRRPPLPNTALCTMRLAAALHPGWADVTLEALAARLGVPVVGRHTASRRRAGRRGDDARPPAGARPARPPHPGRRRLAPAQRAAIG